MSSSTAFNLSHTPPGTVYTTFIYVISFIFHFQIAKCWKDFDNLHLLIYAFDNMGKYFAFSITTTRSNNDLAEYKSNCIQFGLNKNSIDSLYNETEHLYIDTNKLCEIHSTTHFFFSLFTSFLPSCDGHLNLPNMMIDYSALNRLNRVIRA